MDVNVEDAFVADRTIPELSKKVSSTGSAVLAMDELMRRSFLNRVCEDRDYRGGCCCICSLNLEDNSETKQKMMIVQQQWLPFSMLDRNHERVLQLSEGWSDDDWWCVRPRGKHAEGRIRYTAFVRTHTYYIGAVHRFMQRTVPPG